MPDSLDYSNGLVQDLHLKDVHVSGSPCGALAGLDTKGGSFTARSPARSAVLMMVGGLVGYNMGGLVIGCESQAQVRGEDGVGTLVGACSRRNLHAM